MKDSKATPSVDSVDSSPQGEPYGMWRKIKSLPLREVARGTSDGGAATCKIKNKIWLHTKLQTNAVVLLSEKIQTKRQSIDCL